MNGWTVALITTALIVASAFFVIVEFALLAARRHRLSGLTFGASHFRCSLQPLRFGQGLFAARSAAGNEIVASFAPPNGYHFRPFAPRAHSPCPSTRKSNSLPPTRCSP